MRTSITHVAMDTHKEAHTVAVVYGDTGELVVWTVRNTAKDTDLLPEKCARWK